MPNADFWDKVVSDRDPPKRKNPYTQGDIIVALADVRATIQLAAERIKGQPLPGDDQLIKKMKTAYRKALAISRQFETMPVPPKQP